MKDKELVKKAKSGDREAFEQLVTEYEKKVYATAYRFMGSEADAMDMSQEVFIRVFRFLDKFNEESSFSTWLYRITVNVCKDGIKKRSGRSELPLEIPDEDNDTYVNEISDTRYDPSELYEMTELKREIKQGIDTLPQNYREIIMMRDICGLTYEEISRSLELEIGTVKSRISRARERLRKYLLQNGNKPTAFRSND